MAAPEEWRAAGRLVGRALGAAVDVVADTHQAVGDRVGSFLPPGVRSVHELHLSVADGVYSTVAAGHRVVPKVLAEGAAHSVTTPPSQTAPGRVVTPVLNGLKGDLVARDHPELEIPMAVRVDGVDVDPTDLRAAFQRASGDVVVFVHGLAEDDRAWSLGEPGLSYPERLAADVNVTPLLVRYNSGLRISENGTRLASLLDVVTDHWPVPVDSLTFIGHSMGGLVIRSACEQGSAAGHAWTANTAAVITLGSPHTGAPLEKAVNVIDWVMRRIPEAAPIGRVLAERAVGVKDLRFGSLVEGDWQGQDPDALLRNDRADVPLLPHAQYHWIAGSLTVDPQHPIARLMGDGMVRIASASAVGSTGSQVGGTGHMKLLASDEVYTQVLSWVRDAHDKVLSSRDVLY